MPRVCTVCTHPEREAIDEALLNGTTYRDIAGHYDLSKSAVNRHQTEHLPASMVKAQEAAEVAHADNLLDQVRGLQTSTLAILAKAEEKEDLRTALAAIREARGNLELLARLMGELNEGAVVNVLVNPEWHHVRTVIVEALAPFPDARAAVARELVRLDDAA